MATISNIAGAGHPGSAGEVRQTAEPRPASSATRQDALVGSVPADKAPLSPVPVEEQTAPRLDAEQVKDLAQELQEALDRAAAEHHSVSFRLDERTEDFVIEIHDPEGELVKQIPPEKILNLRQKLDELSGMVLDHKS